MSKELAWSDASEGSLPGLQVAAFLPYPHLGERERDLVLLSGASFYGHLFHQTRASPS